MRICASEAEVGVCKSFGGNNLRTERNQGCTEFQRTNYFPVIAYIECRTFRHLEMHLRRVKALVSAQVSAQPSSEKIPEKILGRHCASGSARSGAMVDDARGWGQLHIAGAGAEERDAAARWSGTPLPVFAIAEVRLAWKKRSGTLGSDRSRVIPAPRLPLGFSLAVCRTSRPTGRLQGGPSPLRV